MTQVAALTLERNSLKEQEYALVREQMQIVSNRQALTAMSNKIKNAGLNYQGNDIVQKTIEDRILKTKMIEEQLDRYEIRVRDELAIVRSRLQNVEGALGSQIGEAFKVQY